MANKYEGTCYRCGQIVRIGEGVFEKVGRRQREKFKAPLSEKWLTQHHECAKIWRGTAHHYVYNDLRESEANKKGHKDVQDKTKETRGGNATIT